MFFDPTWRFQVNPEKYKGIATGFRVTVAEEGAKALVKGWAPTAVGYSLQGLGKFGFYEIFKNVYSQALGEVGVYLFSVQLYATTFQTLGWRISAAGISPWGYQKCDAKIWLLASSGEIRVSTFAY